VKPVTMAGATQSDLIPALQPLQEIDRLLKRESFVNHTAGLHPACSLDKGQIGDHSLLLKVVLLKAVLSLNNS